MVHYAAFPEELIFMSDNKDAPSYLEVTYRGTRMMVEPIGFGKAKIVRIISTDPQDYLKPEFQPGLDITFQ